MKRLLFLNLVPLLILAACSSATATSVPAAATQPPPTVAPTSMPATVLPSAPTSEPPSSPVEFVWSITGEPNALVSPEDLAFDLEDNLYVVDAGNSRIQVFDSDGNFLRMWGKPGDGEGEFNFYHGHYYIGGIAVDLEGNVYVADNANWRIQKFDSNGNFLQQWGSRGSDDGQFRSPIGVAVDPLGDVYVIDDARDDIQKFDSYGNFLWKIGGNGTDDGEFSYVGKLEIDQQGNIYVADFSNHRVQKFDGQGKFLTKWGSQGKEPGSSRNLTPWLSINRGMSSWSSNPGRSGSRCSTKRAIFSGPGADRVWKIVNS